MVAILALLEVPFIRLLLYNCAMRITLAAALALLSASPAIAQFTPRRPQPPSASGVIAGRVTASGHPAVGALVTVLRESVPAGTTLRHLGPRDVRLVASTNARGEYRLANVPEGQYAVVAIPRMRSLPTAARRGHAITYYPGAIDPSEAREIVVHGSEPVAVDIRLVPARVSVISGVAIGSNGRPLSNGIIQLGLGAPLYGVGGTSLPISSDGSFTSPALPPGIYSLQTTDGLGAAAMSRVDNPVLSGARVTVREADVTGVRLEPVRRSTVRGRIVPTRGLVVQGLSVSAIPVINEGPNGPQTGGVVRADGTFQFQTWPRRVLLRVVGVETIAAGTRTREDHFGVVRVNGTDVTTTGIDIQPGRDVTGVVIELTR